MRKAAYIYFEEAKEFVLSEAHPYKPARARVTLDMISRFGLMEKPGLELVSPKPVSMEELAEVHDPEYLRLLEMAGAGEFSPEMLAHGIGTEDCPAFPGLMDFQRMAAGATMEAAGRVMDMDFHFAFNPVGGFHHAGVAVAGGFCYVNDVCLAAKRWADMGLKVMVVDIDAHHGNGTQDFFYRDPLVLTVSFHESGKTLYPFGGEYIETGEGDGTGYNVNVPLAAWSDDEVFTFAFDEVVPALFDAFRPDVTIGVMGVDAHSTDPLTHLNMTNNSYLHAVQELDRLSSKWIALGAGGYNQDNVTRGYTLLWAAVTGQLQDEFAVATVGGVFMGDTDLGVANLRDMAVRSSGPAKLKAFQEAEQAVEFIEAHQLRVLGAAG